MAKSSGRKDMVESSERPAFTVEWKIPYVMLNKTKYRHSYVFPLPNLQKTDWRLGIQVQETILGGWIQRLSKGDAGQQEVNIECDFDLFLVREDPNATRSLRGDNPPAKVAKIGFKWAGSSAVTTIAPLSAIDALKDEDVLLLRFRIWPRDYSFLHPERHVVRSDWGRYECVTWRVKNFTKLRGRMEKKEFMLKETEISNKKWTCYLFVLDDNDTIYIAERDTGSYWISTVSAVDASGGKILLLKHSLPYHPSHNADRVTFQLLLRRRELLKKKFLPKDQLTLYFDLRARFCEGVLENRMVGDTVVDDEMDTHSISNIIDGDGAAEPTQTTSPTKMVGDSAVKCEIDAPSISNIIGGDGTAELTQTASPTTSSLYLTDDSKTSNLYHFYKNGTFTDCELRFGSGTVRVHKNILAAQSSVLLDMLSNGCDSVDMQELDLDTGKYLIHFMYLDSVPDLDWDSAIKLYSAAHKYRVVSLRERCSEILKLKLSVQKVGTILLVADAHGDSELKEFAEEFILRNWNPVLSSPEWQNFMKEHTYLAAAVIQKIGNKLNNP